jgi:isopenicillin-N epimerase
MNNGSRSGTRSALDDPTSCKYDFLLDNHHPPKKDHKEGRVRTDSDVDTVQYGWTFLNHGAFGGALKVGYDRATQWRYYMERQPLRYFDRDLLPHLVESARRLAHFCHSPKDSLTLIPNVTYGLNTVIRGYVDQYKDNHNPQNDDDIRPHIILWDTSYGSLKKIASEYCPGRVTEIPLSAYFHNWACDDNGHFESDHDPDDVFERAFTDTLRSLDEKFMDLTGALFVLDHTTSNTALNMPLQVLSKLAKDRGMLVLVDGAHGLLAHSLALNRTALPDVDFYVGNGHKWLCCPRGVGYLYCPHEDLRESILKRPAVLSHGIGQGFQTRFLWDGCRDYAAALSLPAVLDYWEEKDPDIVRSTTQQKLEEAVRILSSRWYGTDNVDHSLLGANLSFHSPMMALIRLPDSLQSSSIDMTSDDAKAIQDFLYDKYIEVPIKCIHGVLYVRISCHVYNSLSEYDRLATVMLQYPTTG